MTDTTEPYPAYDKFVDLTQYVKSQTVAKYTGQPDTTDDIPPALHLVATVPFELDMVIVAPQIDRDMALAALHLMVPGINADVATFMSDSHIAATLENPATGKPWGPGEMQAACDVEGACTTGILDDCLMYHTQWREGRQRMDTRIYTVTKGDPSTMVWSGTKQDSVIDTEDGKGSATGRVPHAFEQAFARPTVWQTLNEGYGTSEAALQIYRAAMDLLVQQLHTKGFIVLARTNDDALRSMVGA